MTKRENIRTIEELYAAFGRADLPFMLDMLAEDVDWQHPRPADIPWGGKRRGPEEVAPFFAAIFERLEVEQFSPEQFVARGDQVIVFGHERMRTRTTGRVYRDDWVHAFKLRSGKIVEFREYTDTATIVDALAEGCDNAARLQRACRDRRGSDCHRRGRASVSHTPWPQAVAGSRRGQIGFDICL